MRTHLLLGFDQRQRIGMPGTDLTQGAKAIAEGLLQFGEEGALIQRLQARGIIAGTGPNQRAAVVRQRQHGHRPFVGEALKGLTGMRLGGADIGDQGHLPIGRVAHRDAQLLAQAGAAAIGQHGQIAVENFLIIEGQPVAITERLQAGDFGRAAPAHHVTVEGLPQAVAEPGVLHHIAEGGNAFIFGTQARSTKAATVRDMNLRDGLGTRADRRPQTEALVDLPSAEGQRRGTRVIARLVAVAGGKRLDQHNLPAARLGTGLQGQGQARADQATADNRQLYPLHRLKPPDCEQQPSAPLSRRPSSARRW